MQKLVIEDFHNRDEKTELTDEDKILVNSIVRSGFTELNTIGLANNKTWWADSEAQEYL